MSNSKAALCCAAAAGAAIGAVALALVCKIKDRRQRADAKTNCHTAGSEASEIDSHIWSTQVPARALGIVVDSADSSSLVLSAPLLDNKNVHGTAFAGSLYAIGVLCSYYLGRAWVRHQGLADAGYELVAKSGSVQYKRPVTTSRICAKSVLPSAEALANFRRDLEAKGKAVVVISGCVLGAEEKVACEYQIEVCAFLPRR